MVKVLLSAADALNKGARETADSGRLAQSLRRLREAEQLYDILSSTEVVALDTVQTSIDVEQRTRILKRAELFRLEGWIGLRRIRPSDALAAFEKSMNIHRDALQDELAAATAQTSMAMAHLAAGQPDKALEVTAAVEAEQGLGGDPVVRAGNFLVQGWARFNRGEYARAYGNANYALARLHDADMTASHPLLFARLYPRQARQINKVGIGLHDEARDS